MQVLVTGDKGLVGGAVCTALSAQGHTAIGFDIKHSQDILQPDALAKAASGRDAIVHSAALLGFPGPTDEQVMAVNLQGTWNVLQAALAADISRIVFLSSVDVLGVFKGERAPDFLPIDESHPCYPTTAYGISKYLAENMCEKFALAHGLTVISLRPPGVWQAPATYEWIVEERAKRAAFEWDPFWEYGAFIDVRDLAEACVRSLEAAVVGYHCVLVASDDITTSGRSSRQLSAELHPDVKWRGGPEFAVHPYQSLVSNHAAKRLLDWQPAHSWADFTPT